MKKTADAIFFTLRVLCRETAQTSADRIGETRSGLSPRAAALTSGMGGRNETKNDMTRPRFESLLDQSGDCMKGTWRTMIQLLIKNESDLYNPYDPSRTRINDGVYHYLKSYCSALEASEHIHDTLQIITDSPIDTDRFQRVLLDAVNRDIAEFDRQLARNKRRALWEGIIGLFFTALGIVLSFYQDKLFLAIISIFGSIGVRDAITIMTSFNHDIKRLKKLLYPIRDIQLEVNQR